MPLNLKDMTLLELKKIVDATLENYQGQGENMDVVVTIRKRQNSFGGTPSVKIEQACPGFDWNSGKFMLFTEEEITKFKQDE